MRWKLFCGTVGLAFAVAAQAFAFDGIVEKKEFHMPSYTTVAGQTIKNVRIGYESYGTLNAAKDNVILIAHFFSGTSHVAGKYAADDKTAGYWDSLVGPGKAFDTNKFFIISSDTLANINAKNPKVITTGPASINPDTGKSYGMSFPVVAIADFVRVQKALLDSLGIKKLHAVAGASMGSEQTMEWAADYPDMVPRAIAVIPPGLEMDAYRVAAIGQWAAPIRLDPRWNKGDYYGKEEPIDGLSMAFSLVVEWTVCPPWVTERYSLNPADNAKAPGKEMDNLFAVEDGLNKAGALRAKVSDANHFLYISKAAQLFNVTTKADAIKAKVLFIPAKTDLLFPPSMSYAAADILKARGKSAEVFELDGTGGHNDGVLKLDGAASKITEFLK